jgi:prepilin-type N-terminal cleavage/methylation domain-containing protein
MNKQKGFSLIELLIVVAIILIIAAIAVPNLLKSKMAANEASAAASERTIGTANVTFSSTYNNGFALALVNLGPPASGAADSNAADLIDATLAAATSATAVKTGYWFTYTSTGTAPSTTYSNVAQPQTPNSTGNATFCLDQTNVLKKDPAGTTTGADGTGCGTYAGTAM